MKKASVLLYIIGALFLVTSLVHFLALVMIFRSWNWLRVFEIYPGTSYLVFKNLFFTAGFILSGLSLLMRRHWAPWLGSTISMLLMVWFWLDRTILSQSPLPFSQQILVLILSLLFLTLVLVSMWLLSPEMKQKFIKIPSNGEIL